MRHDLTARQAAILREKNKKALDALAEWHAALDLAGVDHEAVESVELGEDPHIIVKHDALSP